MITELQLLNAQERIQDNLLCLLDGLPGEAQARACQYVVDEFKPLLEQVVNESN